MEHKLSHFMLSVKDVKKAIEFYKTLGFELEYEKDGWAELKWGNMELALKSIDADDQVTSGVGFHTDDCKALTEKFKQQGLTVTKDCEVRSDGIVLSQVVDPDGNVVWFAQSTK